MKVASCTKLITSIAAMQCVERGLIGLDDSVFPHLPELAALEIVTSPDEGKTLEYAKPKGFITIRQLLTHSSGLAYDGLSPLILAHRKAKGLPEPKSYPNQGTVAECYSSPMVFEPGQGWIYSPGLDWAGHLVRRLNNNITLEEYFVENIFKPAGAPAPYPTFNLSAHPDLKARLFECATRTPEGGLAPVEAPFGDLPKDEHGGSGLALSTQHYLAVLADLLSDNSKILKQDTIKDLLSPQFAANSPSEKMLAAFAQIYAPMTGGEVGIEGVNYALGGFCMTKGAKEASVPPGTVSWWGFTNPVWQINKEKGVAGFAGFQHLPPGDPQLVAVDGVFWKEFWETFAS